MPRRGLLTHPGRDAAPAQPDDRVRELERGIARTVEITLGLATYRKGEAVRDLESMARQRRTLIGARAR